MLGTRKAKYIHERFWTDLSYQLKGGLAKERYLQAQSRLWAGDMTPILRAGTNPAEDLSSSPRTCVKWLPTSCNSSSTGSNILFCLCWVLNACLETHKNTHVQAITNKSLKTEQTKMCKESDNWNWGLLNWDLATKKMLHRRKLLHTPVTWDCVPFCPPLHNGLYLLGLWAK